MIRAILLDVDGVIVGEKIGFNSPEPNPQVLNKLQKIQSSGIPIILCTGKTLHAVQNIIKICKLKNLHIADCGAIIADPLANTFIKIDVMNKNLVHHLISTYLEANIYIEAYAKDKYFIQKDQYRENLTPVHSHILFQEPIMVGSLLETVDDEQIIRVLPVAVDESEAKKLHDLFMPFDKDATLTMGTHPIANPHKFGVITSKGISKRNAATETIRSMGIPFSDFLGIGDSSSDWQYMELCGYAGAVGNATEELKQLVSSKGKKGYVSEKTVDENGILPILDYFSL